MRWLVAAMVLTLLGLGVARASGIAVTGGLGGATGSGDVFAPPGTSVTKVVFVPKSSDISQLDKVKITLDRSPDGPLLHLNVFVQLRNSGGGLLGTPKRINDFANGIDGSPAEVAVSFFGDNIAMADIDSIDVTACQWHSGDGDFECHLP